MDPEQNKSAAAPRRICRWPFVAPLIGLTISVAVTTSTIIGLLSFGAADTSVSAVTATLRSNVISRANDTVNTNLRQVIDVLDNICSNPSIRDHWSAMKANSSIRVADPAIMNLIYHWGTIYTQLKVLGFHTYSQQTLVVIPDAHVLASADASIVNTTTSQRVQRRDIIAGVDGKGMLTLIPMDPLYYPLQPNTMQVVVQGNTSDGMNTAKLQPFVVGPDGELFLSIISMIWENVNATTSVPGQDPIAFGTVAMTVKKMETILQSIYISPNSVISLWEMDYKLIATSVRNQSREGATVGRYTALNTPLRIVRETGLHIRQTVSRLSDIPDGYSTMYTGSDGQGDVLVDMALIRNNYGMNWLVVISVPKDDFLKTIFAARKTMTAVICGTVVGLVALSAVLSYVLVSPIRRLSVIMEQAKNFDFSAVRSGYLTKSSFADPAEIVQCKKIFSDMLKIFADAIKSNKELSQRSAGASKRMASQKPSVIATRETPGEK